MLLSVVANVVRCATNRTRGLCSAEIVIVESARKRPRGLRSRISRTGEFIEITGEVKYYENRADSGNTFSRGFCPDCGSRIFGKTSGFPQFVLITAGSLDDPSSFKPAMDFFTSSAQPWDYMDPNLPKFAKQPKV